MPEQLQLKNEITFDIIYKVEPLPADPNSLIRELLGEHGNPDHAFIGLGWAICAEPEWSKTRWCEKLISAASEELCRELLISEIRAELVRRFERIHRRWMERL